LANIFPSTLASIAVIAVGLALAFEGGTISSRYTALMPERDHKTQMIIRKGSVTTLFLAGASGIALGILSLIGMVPNVLIPVSAIVFGAALILDSGANERLSAFEFRRSEQLKVSQRVIKEADHSAAGIQVLIGIGGIVLGIIALNGIDPLILGLVAMLSFGTGNLLTGAMFGSIFR
jgi:hypothetical protein